jgi:hypothetical protein
VSVHDHFSVTISSLNNGLNGDRQSPSGHSLSPDGRLSIDSEKGRHTFAPGDWDDLELKMLPTLEETSSLADVGGRPLPVAPRLRHVPTRRAASGLDGAAERDMRVALRLIHFALGLHVFIAGHFPDRLLDNAFRLVGRPSHVLLVHRKLFAACVVRKVRSAGFGSRINSARPALRASPQTRRQW